MTLVKHLVLILLAYLAAAVATGFVVDMSLLTYQGGMGDDARRDVLGFGLLASFFVFMYAAAPAALTVAVGEYFSNRRLSYYAVAGSAIGFFLGLLFKPPDFFPWLGLGFGPVSGLIYWLIAGRRAGLDDGNQRIFVAAVMAVVCVSGFLLAWASWFGNRF